MFAYEWTTDTATMSFIEFDISKFAGLIVENPKIVLRGDPKTSTNFIIDIKLVTDPWNDTLVTWNNKPGGGSTLGSLQLIAGQRVQSTALAAFTTKLNEAIRSGQKKFSVRLSSSGMDTVKKYVDRRK
ncbi:MAG: DNRLRE domain-containing protein [Bacteroidales bacterium]|nr:DNRLRE domain-containing protein [Bacteroidales bacterium]